MDQISSFVYLKKKKKNLLSHHFKEGFIRKRVHVVHFSERIRGEERRGTRAVLRGCAQVEGRVARSKREGTDEDRGRKMSCAHARS